MYTMFPYVIERLSLTLTIKSRKITKLRSRGATKFDGALHNVRHNRSFNYNCFFNFQILSLCISAPPTFKIYWHTRVGKFAFNVNI